MSILSSHSYILQIILWHQSLKSIQYRTLYISQNKTNQQIRGQNMGGDKRHVIPPQDLRPCVALVVAFVKVLWIMDGIEHYNSGSFV